MDTIGVVNAFHRTLLSWDYFELCDKAEVGSGVVDKLKPVPDVFKDIEEYKTVFSALLLEEACAQMLRGVEEGVVLSPHPAVVASAETKEDFTFCKVTMEEGITELYTDNDLVLLCKDNPEEEEGTHELHAMGYCEAHEGAQSVRVKFYLADISQSGRPNQLNRVRAMRAGVTTPGSCWWLLRLGNMSTITREWIALQHCQLVPFADILISGRSRAAPDHKHMDIPRGMNQAMEEQCNEYQMQALKAGLDGTPVVLIQGPPGTGKTRTILNLLSVVLHSARKGSVALQASEPVSVQLLTPPERHSLWMEACPWLTDAPDIRDEGPKSGVGSGEDCFGMMQRAMPQRISQVAGPKAHVLVCAPSNSALDEIMLRIINTGLMDKDGRTFAPSVVRVGVNVHHSVKSVSLDTLVDARLGGDNPGSKNLSRVERDRMRVAVLDEAAIVGSTLSFSGSSVFQRLKRRFDVVIIDEAAQAVEPSVLVPLVSGAKQVYLVGDPVQLPATVISSRAVEHKYDQSLFKRLQQAGYPVHVLSVQYRMNPDISRFPSREFYNGALLDGPGVTEATHSPWHQHRCFGPLAFYHVQGRESVPEGSASIINKDEVELVLAVYRELTTHHPDLRKQPSIAIISPYKAQVKMLRECFKKALGEDGARVVDINTIDGFQGREKDITIFSAVRSFKQPAGKKSTRSIGFVADERRINVALTRARCSLIIIGNAQALQTDGHWANLVEDAQQRGCFYCASKPFTECLSKLVAGEQGPSATIQDVVPAEGTPAAKKRKRPDK